jgi:CheY-like chemotaxis protein
VANHGVRGGDSVVSLSCSSVDARSGVLLPVILYFAADLLWASKIKATADALGVPCRPVRSLEMLEARLADCPVTALLADLDKPDVALALIRRLREPGQEAGRKVRVLAWGPHVEKALLQQARDAGADDVLTRGAFDHGMEEILLSLAGRAGA